LKEILALYIDFHEEEVDRFTTDSQVKYSVDLTKVPNSVCRALQKRAKEVKEKKDKTNSQEETRILNLLDPTETER
jgi:hypothetical protein